MNVKTIYISRSQANELLTGKRERIVRNIVEKYVPIQINIELSD